MQHSLTGWDISRPGATDWVPWGSADNARAKILAVADGYHVVLVEAEAGYAGEAHDHAHTEFLYVLEGTLRNQGQVMSAGDAYAAAIGSSHTDFATDHGATYLLVFKL